MAGILLFVGGFFNILLALFFLIFWKSKELNWKQELPKLSPGNRAIVKGGNILIIYVLCVFGIVSFLLALPGPPSLFGDAFIIFIGGFYLLLAILELLLHGISREGIVIALICLIMTGCYTVSFFIP